MSGSDLRDMVLAIIMIADTLVFGVMLWRWLSSAPVAAFIGQRGHALALTLQPRPVAIAARQGFNRHLAHG